MEDKSPQLNIRIGGLKEGEEGDDPDQNAILKGACTEGPIQHKGRQLQFFPDYSTVTANKRRAMAQARKKRTQIGVSSFMLYPAAIKVTHKGNVSLLETPVEVEQLAAEIASSFPPSNVVMSGDRIDM
ncbi:hypothetical protein MHYP_G00290710 [Metynnis hypsauchen]